MASKNPTPRTNRMSGILRRSSTIMLSPSRTSSRPSSIHEHDSSDSASIVKLKVDTTSNTLSPPTVTTHVVPCATIAVPVREAAERELPEVRTVDPDPMDAESPVGYVPPPLIDSTLGNPGAFTDWIDEGLPQPVVISDPYMLPSPESVRSTSPTCVSLLHEVPAPSQAPAHLLSVLSYVLENSKSRNELCDLKGDHAQIMVDYLHSLLLETSLPLAWLQKHSLIALYKLSKASLLYPHCYPLKDIVIGSRESGGAFSEVYRGIHGEQQLCLKVMRLRRKSDIDAMLKIYAKEAIIWGQLHHPNVVPFYGVYYLNGDREQLCLVSPWMHNGNLVDYLKSNCTAPRIPFISDIIAGLEYLHGQSLVHSDMKGLNILVNSSERACIADFGLSFVRTDQTIAYTLGANTTCGFSHHWAAPELLDDDARATMASDVWALGGVCFEVLTGLLPFQGFSEAQIIRKLIKGETPTLPRNSGPNSTRPEDIIWDLVKKCWAIEPEARPTCTELSQELEKMGLKREQVNSLEDISQSKQSFWDTMRTREATPVDLSQVEHILNEVVSF